MQRFRAGNGDVVVLDEAAVRQHLDMRTCIAEVEKAFAALANGSAPKPGVLGFESPGGSFHVKAAAWPDVGYFVAKVNSNYPGNPRRGIPTIQGLVLLYEMESGVPVAVLDSAELTARRTGAATGVAVKQLTPERGLVMTLIGCGRQAPSQIEAVLAVRSVERLFVHDADVSAAQHLADALSTEVRVEVATADWRACARASDLVITCTPAQQPILARDDVRAGCLVAAVGADNPHKQELEPALMARAKVVCDVTEQCAVMGDLHHALEAGVMKRSDVFAELGEVVTGSKAGRANDEEIIVFDSTGMALQDLVAARVAIRAAAALSPPTP